ncbi:MAG: hypothetical protein KC621_17725 [Myxococcales bacterium]|nr:hypothetical protein [Myxococcales bacterium]
MLASLMVPAVAAPVVHEGPPDVAIELVRTVEPSSGTLVPRSWASITSEAVVIAEGGTVRGCDGSRRPSSDLGSALEVVWSSFLYGDFDRGLTEAEAALRLIPCLDGTPDPEELARALRLLGLHRYLLRDEPGAVRAWRDARVLSVVGPGEDWPEAARAAFFAARPPATVPLAAPAGVLVDGTEAPGMLAPGHHVITIGRETWLVDTGASSSITVVAPAAYAGRTLAEVAGGEELSPLLAGVFGEGTDVWVALSDRALRLTAGRKEVEVSMAPVVEVTPPVRRARSAGAWVAALGGGVALGGAVGTAAALSATSGARSAYADATDPADILDARARFDRTAAWVVPAEWITGVGAAVGTAGLVLHVVVGPR